MGAGSKQISRERDGGGGLASAVTDWMHNKLDMDRIGDIEMRMKDRRILTSRRRAGEGDSPTGVSAPHGATP